MPKNRPIQLSIRSQRAGQESARHSRKHATASTRARPGWRVYGAAIPPLRLFSPRCHILMLISLLNPPFFFLPRRRLSCFSLPNAHFPISCICSPILCIFINHYLCTLFHAPGCSHRSPSPPNATELSTVHSLLQADPCCSLTLLPIAVPITSTRIAYALLSSILWVLRLAVFDFSRPRTTRQDNPTRPTRYSLQLQRAFQLRAAGKELFRSILFVIHASDVGSP